MKFSFYFLDNENSKTAFPEKIVHSFITSNVQKNNFVQTLTPFFSNLETKFSPV